MNMFDKGHGNAMRLTDYKLLSQMPSKKENNYKVVSNLALDR